MNKKLKQKTSRSAPPAIKKISITFLQIQPNKEFVAKPCTYTEFVKAYRINRKLPDARLRLYQKQIVKEIMIKLVMNLIRS